MSRSRVGILSVLAVSCSLSAATASAGSDWVYYMSYGRWLADTLAGLAVNEAYQGIALRDLNGDGRIDFLTTCGTGIGAALGNADGTFQPMAVFGISTGFETASLAAGDLNCDGHVDAVAANGGGMVEVFPGNGDGTFGPRTDYVVGSGSSYVDIGDVNGDGKQDLAVGSQGTGMISVYLGDGMGGFGPPTNYSAAGPPWSLRLADLNGDGKLDLVWQTNGVDYRIGNGDGTFGALVSLPPPANMSTFRAADFNRDGRLDLAWIDLSPNPTNDILTVTLALPSGGFGAPMSVVLPSRGGDGLVTGDFNGDGALDIVVALRNGTAWVRGHGDGTFDLPVRLPGVSLGELNGIPPTQVESADMNQDGHADLVLGTPLVELGNGDGTFGNASNLVPTSGPSSVAIEDWNGDGKKDLAVTCRAANVVSVFFNAGGGLFGSNHDFPVGAGPVAVRPVDLNGDGREDLVTANPVGGNVSVLINNGLGGFLPKTDYALANAIDVKAGNFDANEKPDLVAINGSSYAIFPGNGDGTLGAPATFPLAFVARHLAVADLNADGVMDLVLGASNSVPSPRGIYVLIGNGDGTFQTPFGYETMQDLSNFAVGDWNGDGRVDIAFSAGGPPRIGLLIGNGDGTFSEGAAVYCRIIASWLAGADLDGDSRLDIAASDLSGHLWLLRGNGDGTFAPPGYGYCGPGVQTGASGALWNDLCAVGDYRGDGRAHIVVAGEASNFVALLRNQAQPPPVPPITGFASHLDFATQFSPQKVVTADFNRDGKLDAAAAANASNAVSLLLGNGDGTMGPSIGFPASFAAVDIATADLNRDGAPDVVTVGVDGMISILLGNGLGGFAPKTDIAAGGTMRALAIADVNGNGTLDIVVVDQAAGVLKVYQGLGNGTFSGFISSTLPSGACAPTDLDLVDVNCDGRPDAIVAEGSCRSVDVLLNDGTGHFTGSGVSNGSEWNSVARVRDLNGDGIGDLLVLGGNGDLMIRLGDPSSSSGFGPLVTYAGIPDPTDLSFTDADLDGKLDLLLGSNTQPYFELMRGNGDGTFAAGVTYTMGGTTLGVTSGDFNHDGVSDVASVNGNAHTLSITLGKRDIVTAVDEVAHRAPAASIRQNKPNPFNPSTEIDFYSPRNGAIRLRIFDVSGRWVTTLVDRALPAGLHRAVWDGRDASGNEAASGVYFYRLEAGSFADSRRMVLLR